MQAIGEAINQTMATKLTWASEYCTNATHVPAHIKPRMPNDDDWDAVTEYQVEMQKLCDKYKVQKIIIDGQVVCPRCKCEQYTAETTAEFQSYADHLKKNDKTLVLYNQSVLQDETILYARFDNYRTEDEPLAYQNLLMMKQHATGILNGEKFNILLYGPPGVGKSHLSYSLLYDINVRSNNQMSCLFIDIDEMLRRLRDSFNNPESKYTELYFTRLMSEVDVLVLDDLGAETGNEQTEKRASDFTGRILRAVVNSRQQKVTVVTTNLGGEQLNKMYDGKMLSRLSKNRKAVLFDDRVKDKRPLEGY
ncbi:ATP-binding protein [Solibacillus sp. CAU 1738]|uniref:ATP-binding protein n=1 Tax=Solibacillus sp. CAU 1738 TaxID=3140363 RepID=UPI003261797B